MENVRKPSRKKEPENVAFISVWTQKVRDQLLEEWKWKTRVEQEGKINFIQILK